MSFYESGIGEHGRQWHPCFQECIEECLAADLFSNFVSLEKQYQVIRIFVLEVGQQLVEVRCLEAGEERSDLPS